MTDRSGDKEARRETQREMSKDRRRSKETTIGQEKKPPVRRLLKRWAWKRRRGHAGVLKYCLENASCMTIAVKPKKRKHGGYLITTPQKLLASRLRTPTCKLFILYFVETTAVNAYKQYGEADHTPQALLLLLHQEACWQ
ncbi:hypothetical protein YC2023_058249 [Brassica napus]